MPKGKTPGPVRALTTIANTLVRPEILVFLPALILAGLWFGPKGLALVAAFALPAAFLTLRHDREPGPLLEVPTDVVTGLPLRTELVARLDRAFAEMRETGRTTACLMVALDEAGTLEKRFGAAGYNEILARTADRLSGVMRGADVIARMDGATFAVGLAPVKLADLETVIQIATRLQAAVEEPLSIDAATVYVSASVGFCLATRAPHPTGASLLAATEAALRVASANGPSGIRAFSVEIERAEEGRAELRGQLGDALEQGQILAFFQPQVSTDTGEVTGFEALARWLHPKQGMLTPEGFLPDLIDSGLSTRLGEVVLYHALGALKAWDKAGLKVPRVSVNFSSEELRNPRLPEKLKWELDRFEVEPSRLAVEILESVVADSDNDVIVHNIAALARMGCMIDLDDFGTGHASITSIRRFDVHRLKIDRSFVTRVDQDPTQQRMISAILSMAEQLGLETLAEGVETIGEHAMLAQLGCGNVQGFGVGRPMALEDTFGWIETHREKLATQAPPRFGRKAS